MGNSVILDIIGSFIVFGLLLLTALRMDTNAIEDNFSYNTAVNLQLQLVSLATQIEGDFRMIGYDVSETQIQPATAAVRYGTVNDFRFASDLNNDGTVDSAEYILGPSQGLRNHNIRTLVRKYWDGKNSAKNRVDSIKAYITQLEFSYYAADRNTSLGSYVDYNSGVGMICLSMTLQSPDKYTGSRIYEESDTALYSVYWKQFQIVSKNMTWR
jgi:hypothetical protein